MSNVYRENMKITLELSEVEIAEAVRYWLDANTDYTHSETSEIEFFYKDVEGSSIPSLAAVISMVEDVG